MFAYRTPRVYFEWVDPRPPGLVPLRTDIAGFVGIAARGPLFKPVKVESWSQFATTFGVHIAQGYLAYGVDGFFANGGQTCWVVRVADADTARHASLELFDGNEPPQPTLRLTASSPGTWGANITVSVTRRGEEHFTMTLQLPGGEREVWRDLTMRKDDPRYVETVLNNPQTGSRLVKVRDLEAANGVRNNAPNPRVSNLRSATGRLRGGKDGLAPDAASLEDSGLRPEHFSSADIPSEGRPPGLGLLETIDEVSIVALPDIMPTPRVSPQTKIPQPRCAVLDSAPEPLPAPLPALEFPRPFTRDEILELQQALIGHCEKLKDRVAILDPPLFDPTLTPEQALAWRQEFNSRYAAFYYPWLLVSDPLRLHGLVRQVPPSGHVAGIYARGDLRVGVHKPPANEVVEGAHNIQTLVDDVVHGDLNEQGVNVIRTYNGRGIRVAGARTLNRNPEQDLQWRYVNVRRLFIMIMEAIDEGTQWLVFEPHNPALWDEMDRVVRNFLDGLWRRGMLDGTTAEEAYFVRCDATTNPPEEMEEGRLICLVGVQPPWPAEFVVVRIGKTEGGTEILEVNGGQNG